jgi:hypothetical protein
VLAGHRSVAANIRFINSQCVLFSSMKISRSQLTDCTIRGNLKVSVIQRQETRHGVRLQT